MVPFLVKLLTDLLLKHFDQSGLAAAGSPIHVKRLVTVQDGFN